MSVWLRAALAYHSSPAFPPQSACKSFECLFCDAPFRLSQGGRSANDTTRTITGVTTCCGTLAYYVPPSPGFVHVYLGSNGERLLPACGSWLCAPAFRPVDVKMMTSYCASSGIATPPKGAL
eukprot:scaffold126165_cov33-Tisochrysis_lutea.AAC.3